MKWVQKHESEALNDTQVIAPLLNKRLHITAGHMVTENDSVVFSRETESKHPVLSESTQSSAPVQYLIRRTEKLHRMTQSFDG